MAKTKNHARAKAAKKMAANIVQQFEEASPRERKDMAAKLVRYLKVGVLTVSSVGEQDGVSLGDDIEAYQRAYSNQVWVYAGINAIATSAAKVPFKVMRKNKKGEMEEVVGHPFIQLLNNPNEHLTGYDLVELMMIFLESCGNSFWLLDDGSGEPLDPDAKLLLKQVKEIWPIFPQHMKPLPRKKTFIGGYKMAANEMGKETVFAPAEILHLKYANPASLYVGQGALEPVRGAIVGDLYAEMWNNTFFKNGAIPPAFLKTDKTLSPEQREELKAQWAKIYGGAKNAHKVALLESGLDFSVPMQSRKDMEFVEGQGQSMKRILGALGVPPIMIGLLDEATYNNAKEQKRVFWENTMQPKLSKIAWAFTNLLHRLGEPKDLCVIADLSGIDALQEDLKGKAETAKVWRDMGVPLNDCIRYFGLKQMEAVEGGDVGLVQAGMITLEEAALGLAGGEPDPEGTPEDAPPKKPGKPAPDPEEDEPGTDGEKSMRRSAKAQDDAHWKSFVTRQRQDVARLRAVLKRHFRSERTKVLELVNAHYKDAKSIPDLKLRSPKVEVFMLPWSQENKDLARESKPHLKQTYGRFGKSAVDEVGGGIDFNLESPAAVRFAESRSIRFAEEVNATTQRRLRELIARGLEEGTSQSDMVSAIRAEFNFAESTRALRIARTETQIAANSGQFEGYRQADVTQVKWLSSRDAQVRPSHAEAEGDIVDLGDPFDVGGALLRWPCDPDGPAAEIINCRCTTRAIINRRTA